MLNISKVIQLGKSNLINLKKHQISLAKGIPTIYCPINKPLYNGRICMGCNLIQYYNLQSFTCYTPSLFTNVSALSLTHQYIQISNYTLSNLAYIYQTSTLPLRQCPHSAPLFNGSSCIKCPTYQYYNLQNNTCYTPHLATNITALNISNKYVNLGSYTLSALQQQIQSSIMPTRPCPSSKPLFNGTNCMACPPNHYYLLKTYKCINATFVSNISALNKSGHVVQIGQYTLSNLKQQILSSKVPTKYCPSTAPMFNGSLCISCSNGTYYLL